MEDKIKMMMTATEVFSFLKKNPNAMPEELYSHVTEFIQSHKISNEKVKVSMIASANKAQEIFRKNPNYPDRILLKEFMDITPSITSMVDEQFQ